MGSLVVIKIPEEFKNRVESFCGERQYTPDGLTITLIEPSLLKNVQGIEYRLQTFCLNQADFNLVIGGPSCYNNQLLYLNVLPGTLSLMRNKLSAYLKLPRDEKPYRPHLTIMRSLPGKELSLGQMLQDARKAFATPYSFMVGELHLYTQKNDDSAFEDSLTIPFTGR